MNTDEHGLGNARYWYRRADRMDRVADEPRAELAAIRDELNTDEHCDKKHLISQIFPQ